MIAFCGDSKSNLKEEIEFFTEANCQGGHESLSLMIGASIITMVDAIHQQISGYQQKLKTARNLFRLELRNF